MEFNEEIVFGGGINTDDEARAVPRGDYRDALYTINGDTYESGFAMTNLRGTLLDDNVSLTAADTVVGTAIWQNRGEIVYLVHRPLSPDEIWRYSPDTGDHNLLAQSNEFNFDPDWPVFHAEVIGDILRWTDGRWRDEMWIDGERVFNPPFQINLQKADDGEYTTIDYQVINAIKFPPTSPTAQYVTDETHADNKLRRKLFRFRIRYIYENDEQTVWSVWSNLALPTQSEFVSGSNWVDSNTDNAIDVSFDTGAEVVKKIEISVQQLDEGATGAETQFGVFLQIDKALEGVANNDTYTYRFYGNTSSKPVSNVQNNKNYDRLPINALCQTILPTSQVAYTNIRENYDNVELQTTIEPVYNEITWTPDYANVYSAFNYLTEPGLTVVIDTILLDQDIFDVAAGDTWTYTIHVTAPSDEYIVLTYTVTQQDYDNALLEATNYDKQYYINGRMVETFVDQINAALGSTVVEAVEDSPSPGLNYWYIRAISPATFTVDSASNRLLNAPIKPNRPTRVVPSLKVGATHRFGIVYFDEGYRDGSVQTNDSLSLFVPWYTDLDLSAFTDPNNPFYTTARMTISHTPPIWAKYYTIVAQRASEISSFGHWVIDAGYNGSTPGTAIQPDGSRYKVYLDKFYTETNVGATINHQIQKGDIVRFYRSRLAAPTSGQVATSPYLTDYFEMEVLDYQATTADSDGRQVIWVEQFNANLLDPSVFSGQLVEIYTPRPSLDTTGDLFTSPWREVTPILEVGNPHTVDAYHIPENTSGEGRVDWVDPDSIIYFLGDWSNLVGWTFTATVESEPPVTGTITSTQPGTGPFEGYTQINFTGTPFGEGVVGPLTWIAYNGVEQVVSGGISTTSAVLNLGYGDVYVRQRNYATGANGPTSCYYFIEDPHYSDYWLSDYHQYGRFQVENPNNKMVHRKATSIHGDAYVLNTNINGLSSFSLLNDNIIDMNPTFGEVIRTYLSGREGKTLKCLQPRKENSIYIQNYPTDVQVPTGELKIKQETFTAWYPYKSNIGCSDAGSVTVLPNGESIYFDRIGGYFIYSSTNGQVLISERDPVTGNNFKFRKKTKELREQLISDPLNFVRSYVDENNGLAGIGFAIASIPSTSGDLVAATSGQNQATVIGNLTELQAQIGQQIIFEIYTDDPDNIEIFSTTLLAAEGGFIGIGITVEDNFPLSATFGGIYYTKTVYNYDTVVFDYINMRWRTRVNYNFMLWTNYGNVLLGWSNKCQMYVHNQEGQYTFHGEDVTQSVTVVSNENPLALKRYQDVTQRANQTFNLSAYAEPNQSYTQMATQVPSYLFSLYEGYSKADYRKNRYSPLYASEEMALMNGEDVRANALTHIFSRPLDSNCVIFSFGIRGVTS